MSAAGKSTLDIARILNDEGITSLRGNRWGKTTVHKVLVNETYTGSTGLGRECQGRGRSGAGGRCVPCNCFQSPVQPCVQADAVPVGPKVVNPRRAASPFLLSGLVKCKSCRRALTGQYAKSGKFPYYVCQTLMKQGSGSCDTPRLNARRFENLVVEKIRSSILTEEKHPRPREDRGREDG